MNQTKASRHAVAWNRQVLGVRAVEKAGLEIFRASDTTVLPQLWAATLKQVECVIDFELNFHELHNLSGSDLSDFMVLGPGTHSFRPIRPPSNNVVCRHSLGFAWKLCCTAIGLAPG